MKNGVFHESLFPLGYKENSTTTIAVVAQPGTAQAWKI